MLGQFVEHISVRVPWHDTDWTGRVCGNPIGNGSCILLKNIGEERDDSFEVTNANSPFGSLDAARVPCLRERATFLSPTGFSYKREHPYGNGGGLRGHLRPAEIHVPAYGVQAIPFFWLQRRNLERFILPERPVPYSSDAEAAAISSLGFDPGWLLHGDNQQAALETFFGDVVPGESLLFFYLKHSPFQDADNRRLLVGAAKITDISLPGRWPSDGSAPFPSHMWETSLLHSLRPSMKDGVLLPYQRLFELQERDGVDIGEALAWAPEHTARESRT